MLLTYRDLLRDIFFCITFQWTARRLPVLQLVLHTIQDYPTNTTVCLITNEPERLRTVLKHWNFDRVTVCGEERTLGHAFQLAWVHREVMETVFQRDDHSLFIYQEDDLGLSWPALEAWAHDETLLVPMGLHRGFVRVQPSQWDGTLITMDQLTNTSLGAGTTISIPHASKHPDGEGSTSHFVHLAGPYMAMWLASRPQLETWQKSPQWSAQRNGYHGNPSREDAAQGLYGMQGDHFVHKAGLTGFRQTVVVPYDAAMRQVLPIATITHLDIWESRCSTNEPQVPGSGHCTIPFAEILVD
ncbi:g6791 [Coccomyxa viridis]|uniref:G6791 protein n=1 Tax=Coccomyxa viridis TaxID=1274662 RepID=A0ABP1FW75_9CHLO